MAPSLSPSPLQPPRTAGMLAIDGLRQEQRVRRPSWTIKQDSRHQLLLPQESRHSRSVHSVPTNVQAGNGELASLSAWGTPAQSLRQFAEAGSRAFLSAFYRRKQTQSAPGACPGSLA